MTAPDRTTWTVAEDPAGDLTLWYGDTAVLRRFVLGGAFAPHADLLWQVLTRVLAPDEATIERLARALYTADGDDPAELEILPPPLQRAAWNRQQRHARAALTALADTSAQALGPDPAQARIDSIAADRAQARHTDGDESAGGA